MINRSNVVLCRKAAGSFTVEAALIMPVILGIIVMFLYAAMFCHDRGAIEYVIRIACERAVYEEDQTGEAAEEYTRHYLSERLICKWDISVNSYETDDSVVVSVQASTPLFGGTTVHKATVLKHFFPKY